MGAWRETGDRMGKPVQRRAEAARAPKGRTSAGREGRAGASSPRVLDAERLHEFFVTFLPGPFDLLGYMG